MEKENSTRSNASHKKRVVNKVSKKSGDIDKRDEYGATAIYRAIFNRDLDLTLKLIKKGADVNQKVGGDTLLIAAIRIHCFDIAAELINHGCDVNELNCNEDSPLSVLINIFYWNENECFELLEKLVDNGADVNYKKDGENTPLISLTNHFKFFKSLLAFEYLLENGADVNKTGTNGNTPLLATANNRIDFLKALLPYKPKIDIKNNAGYTALLRAATSGGEKEVELLIDSGADVNIRSRSGITPLMKLMQIARYSEKQDIKTHKIAKCLIERGCDIHAEDVYGINALNIATNLNDNQMVMIISREIAKRQAKQKSIAKSR